MTKLSIILAAVLGLTFTPFPCAEAGPPQHTVKSHGFSGQSDEDEERLIEEVLRLLGPNAGSPGQRTEDEERLLDELHRLLNAEAAESRQMLEGEEEDGADLDKDRGKKQSKKDKDKGKKQSKKDKDRGKKQSKKDKELSDAGSSSGVAKGDFNGDGFADLAIGVPGKDTPAGVIDSGAVIIIYGSANGLTATDPAVPARQFWSQNSLGVPDSSEAGDRFGSALASGDFNGDGLSDLSIGAPGENATFTDGGAVTIIYGSSRGLAASGPDVVLAPRFFSFPIVPLASGAGAALGSSLAWGDFNGDGVGDLAIGAPFTRLTGAQQGGAVLVLFGSRANGLTTAGNQFLTQELTGLGSSGIGDFFGQALAAGNFNGDFIGTNAVSDLAIGVPGESNLGLFGAIPAAGRAVVLLGSSSGLTRAGAREFSQLTLGSTPIAGDRFGSALAVGDFDRNGAADLAVGVPFGRVGGLAAAGFVRIIRGLPGVGLVPNGPQLWTQNQTFSAALRPAFGSLSEAGDRFGSVLAAGDFNGDGRADLAIGVPLEDVINPNTNGRNLPDAGEVDVIFGSATGLSITAHNTRTFSLGAGGERFGAALSAWNFDGFREPATGLPTSPVGTADLAIGIPNLAADGGVVAVFYGSRAENDLSDSGVQIWTQGILGFTSAPGDLFGGALY